jgi:hypothetical protein
VWGSGTRVRSCGVDDHDVAAGRSPDRRRAPARDRAARAVARAAAWAAGAAPTPGQWLFIDLDATLTIDHSDRKAGAAATWKKTFGHHPLLAFLDRPEIAGGEALAGLLRPGNAGSNTAADHINALRWALASLPAAYRPDPRDPDGQRVVVRSDSAGATHLFAAACRTEGAGFSFGHPVDARVREAAEILNAADARYPAIETGGGIREGAWVAEATALVDMSNWPSGTRLILRKENPHPGAPPRSSPTPPTVWSPGSWLGWNCATVNTPGSRTGSAAPRPPDCATCPVTTPTRTRHGWKSSSRQQIWWPGPNSSGSPTTPSWPAARSKRSATASATSPPASPAAPDKSGYASTPPGTGPPPYPKAGSNFEQPSAKQPATIHLNPKEPALGTPAPPERHRTICHTPSRNQHHQPDPARVKHPPSGRAKNRG